MRATPMDSFNAQRSRGSVFRRAASSLADDASKKDVRGSINTHDDETSRNGAAAYWDAMWQEGVAVGATFDNAKECTALRLFLERNAPVPYARALVPGCGRGYDAALLAAHGCDNVVGLDLSQHAVDAAKSWLAGYTSPNKDAVDFKVGNFFDFQFETQFDVVFDCTFLCALHPEVRLKWAARMGELVKPGGTVVSLVFPIATGWGNSVVQSVRYYAAGPPYSLTTAIVEELLAPHGFTKQSAEDPLPPESAHLPNNPMAFESALAVFVKQGAEDQAEP